MTDEAEVMEFMTFTPQDIWPKFEGQQQFPPVEETEQPLFNQARVYQAWHSAAPLPLRNAYEMPPAALDWARCPHGSEPRDLLFWGHVGTGKSHSAVAAGTLRAASHWGTFRFELAGKVLRQLKNHSDREAMEIMRADTLRPDVLVLDDIGREKLTDVDIASMTELMDERRGTGKVTIFTTNLSPLDFDEYFGSHLTSRLLGGTVVVQVFGEDRRQTH
jgi:DNA replication protein DnaC